LEATPSLNVAGSLLSPSVSKWLSAYDKPAEVVEEPSQRTKEAVEKAKKFYDELDDFSLEEEEAPLEEEEGGEVKETLTEPAPSVRLSPSTYYNNIRILKVLSQLDLVQLHAQSTASLVDEIMIEEIRNRNNGDAPRSYLDDFIFEDDNEQVGLI
jgi:hypothetical protein